VNNSDTANIELSTIMTFQRQQTEMLKNLVSVCINKTGKLPDFWEYGG
jgi:hypothetical protein